MGERVDSVARPACCWLIVARHFARHSCAPILRAPLPFRGPLPRLCPLGVPLGPTRLLAGLLPGRVGEGGVGRPTLALVPPSGSFPTGGLMHALHVRV